MGEELVGVEAIKIRKKQNQPAFPAPLQNHFKKTFFLPKVILGSWGFGCKFVTIFNVVSQTQIHGLPD
jgi:hypothetical protein